VPVCIVGVCRFVLWACAGFFGVLRVSLIENVSFRMQRKDTQTNEIFKSKKFDTFFDTRCGFFDRDVVLLLLLLLLKLHFSYIFAYKTITSFAHPRTRVNKKKRHKKKKKNLQ
jgi:hypothetical protein